MLLKRGFTLVEMLFVVIIAATALALALPSYKSMRERGKFQAASGQLIDLGSAVEAITRDLAMQGVSVTVGASAALPFDGGYFLASSSTPYSLKTKVLEAAAGKPREEQVLKALMHFGYLKKFLPNGFNYYVLTNTSANSTNCRSTATSPLTDGTLVACMIKPSPANNDCFAGARYYKGGRFETIRMANCKNN